MRAVAAPVAATPLTAARSLQGVANAELVIARQDELIFAAGTVDEMRLIETLAVNADRVLGPVGEIGEGFGPADRIGSGLLDDVAVPTIGAFAAGRRLVAVLLPPVDDVPVHVRGI